MARIEGGIDEAYRAKAILRLWKIASLLATQRGTELAVMVRERLYEALMVSGRCP